MWNSYCEYWIFFKSFTFSVLEFLSVHPYLYVIERPNENNIGEPLYISSARLACDVVCR